MIEKIINSDFGSYTQKYNHGYKVNTDYNCIDSFKDPEDGKEWSNCPCCGLKPKVWRFDNGLHTACGCWNNKYDHFDVQAESIMSVHKRTNGERMDLYSTDKLRLNWNEYCATMVSACNHSDLRLVDKW